MKKILYSLSFALLCSLAAPVFAAPAAAQPTGMTQQEFNQKITLLEKNYTERLEKLTKYDEFMKANYAQMSPALKSQLTNKMLSLATSLRREDFLRRCATVAKDVKLPDLCCNVIRSLLSMRNKEVYTQDIADLEKIVMEYDKKSPLYVNGMVNLIKVYAGANPETYAKAEKLYAQMEPQLKNNQKFDLNLNFTKLAFSTLGDLEKAEKWFAVVLKTQQANIDAVAADEKACKADKKKRPNPGLVNEVRNGCNRIYGLINDFMKIDAAVAKQMYAKAKGYLNEDQQLTFELATCGVYALSKSDDATYQPILKKVLALPYSKTRTNIVNTIAAKTNAQDRELLYDSEMKNPAVTPEQKFNIYSGLRNPYKGSVAWFQRGFNDMEAYPAWKKFTLKMLEQNKLCEKRKPANADFYNDAAYTAYGYGDFKFAEDMIEEALKLDADAKNKKYLDTAAMIFLFKKDAKRVSKLINAYLANEKNPNDIRHWRTVDFFNKGGKPAAFDKEFAQDNLKSEEKMNLLRNASELLFRAKRFDICQAIYDDILDNRFVSLKPLEYKAVYMKNPPRTADGFVRTPYYNDWSKMETRFRPYGDCPAISTGTDAKWFLKDVPKETIAKGWETGIFCAFNEEGFHIYVRCNDPEVIDVVQGKRDGGTLECTFRPGPDAPYNMWFFNGLPNSVDEIDIDFASPSPVYKLTRDVFKTDAATTPEGIVAHTFIPWLPYHYSLPFDGKCWYIGLQRWCKGGGQTISGQVHELARMLNVKLDISKAQELEIKKFVCRAAFNKFMKFKDNLNVWATDVELGDPTFYKEALEAYVNELTEAGKLLDDPKADINAIFDKYVPQWAEFDYIVAEKRKNWLKTQFFK